jgi:transcriptional regulator with XRE-family HTH domain
MDDAGEKLKRARERLGLRYRDVENASLEIAKRHHNEEFVIALSRLSDIENKGNVPTIFRLYSLCAIYKLDYREVLEWYGLDLAGIAADSSLVNVERTHMVGFGIDEYGEVPFPLTLDPGIDLKKTTYLSRMIQRWGKLPLALLGGMDLKNHRYGFIGSEDWSMYPLIPPSSLVVIDESRRKVAEKGWSSEHDRPVYFFEHRNGYACGWCTLMEGRLMLQPHPASKCLPQTYAFPDEIDVIGQITRVAMILDQEGRRRRSRS